MTSVNEDIRVTAVAATRATVISAFKEVAAEQGKTLVALSDNLALMESGLDSLCIAIIVARLDDQLGVDPFSDANEMVLPVTVGDFIRIYENAAG